MYFFFFDENLPSGTENPNDESVSPFDSIKHIDENNIEFWYARELQQVLDYKDWRNFDKVITKAKNACEGSDQTISYHFVDINRVVDFGGVAPSTIQDIVLSRYACYLIAMNGDSRKKVIALAQTYFAIKTREQEIDEAINTLSEDERRLLLRQDLKDHNISLAEAASLAGIKDPKDYAIFQNHGYQGLYGGLTAKDIKTRKSLKKSHNILDYMGSEELAANLFRATQTDSKIRRENIKGKANANKTHYEVGNKVRQTIKELGGTMPEDLPTPKNSIKQLESKTKKLK
jgi:DNA-damage-inducible protein D